MLPNLKTIISQYLQILDHHQKNVARLREKPTHKPRRTDNKTAFTDSDFDKFLKEFDFK